MNPREGRVLFMGSPEFAVPSLQALSNAGYNIVASVSQPDRPAGRGGRVQSPAVKVAAIELGIETFQPESLKSGEARAKLAAFAADVFVVAAYGKILPRAVLALPTRGAINVHGSLLPRWRGPSPIAAAVLAGDSATGVSIMELALKMDAGPVITRRALTIRPTDTTGDLEPRLAALGAEALVDVLPGWFERKIAAEPQDEALVIYCRLLTKSDGWLEAKMTATDAERAVRAYNPWPGAFVEYLGERLAIWAAHVSPDPQHLVPGTTTLLEHAPVVAFVDGALVLDEVQRSGARRTTGQQFLNGERGQLAPLVVLA